MRYSTGVCTSPLEGVSEFENKEEEKKESCQEPNAELLQSQNNALPSVLSVNPVGKQVTELGIGKLMKTSICYRSKRSRK